MSSQQPVNNQGFISCESPKQYGVLRPGEYTFEVYAVGPKGNYDHTPASFTWVIEEPEQPVNNIEIEDGNATSTPSQ